LDTVSILLLVAAIIIGLFVAYNLFHYVLFLLVAHPKDARKRSLRTSLTIRCSMARPQSGASTKRSSPAERNGAGACMAWQSVAVMYRADWPIVLMMPRLGSAPPGRKRRSGDGYFSDLVEAGIPNNPCEKLRYMMPPTETAPINRINAAAQMTRFSPSFLCSEVIG
jgi:hypothetical protein